VSRATSTSEIEITSEPKATLAARAVETRQALCSRPPAFGPRRVRAQVRAVSLSGAEYERQQLTLGVTRRDPKPVVSPCAVYLASG